MSIAFQDLGPVKAGRMVQFVALITAVSPFSPNIGEAAIRNSAHGAATSSAKQLICDVASQPTERYGAAIGGAPKQPFTIRIIFEDGNDFATVVIANPRVPETTQRARLTASPTRLTFSWDRVGTDPYGVGVDRQSLALFGGSPEETVSGTCRVAVAPKRQI